MPPKRRPSPPLRSRKPRCRRAGTFTVMAAGWKTPLSKSRLPKLWYSPGFSNVNTGLDCVIPSRLAIGAESTIPQEGTPMTEAKSERTYSDDEIQQRLKRDLPHWYLENGWI